MTNAPSASSHDDLTSMHLSCTSATSIGSQRWWEMMSCWSSSGWDWLNAALVAAPAKVTSSAGKPAGSIRRGADRGVNVSHGDEARAERFGGACTFNLTNFDWYSFGYQHFAEHDKELIGGLQSGPRSVTARPRLRRSMSVERATSYSRQAARTRLDSLRQMVLPKMNDESCGYGPSRRVTNVAWHLRTGDLCDANRTMQTHFDEAFDQMQKLRGARSATATFAHHIFTEVSEAPTTDMTDRSFICLGARLRVRACLNATSGACTVYSAALDGARAGPLSKIRVLVNGEPFATLACMAAADRSNERDAPRPADLHIHSHHHSQPFAKPASPKVYMTCAPAALCTHAMQASVQIIP